MAFFDDIGKKITQAGQDAVQKGKEFAEITKLNSAVSEEEKRLNNTYCRIGKLYAELHREDCEENFAQLIAELSESEAKISKMKSDIQALKGTQVCPGCGAQVPLSHIFCTSCGYKMPNNAPVEENKKVCKVCGNIVDDTMNFCTKCGSKIEPDESITTAEDESSEAEIEAETAAESENNTETISEKTEEGKKCLNCGFVNDDTVLFCVECGTKF